MRNDVQNNSEDIDLTSCDQGAEVQGWFYRKENIRRMMFALLAACVGVVMMDFLYENKHPHFELEKLFGFQAWLGFIAFALIVLLGRLLRIVVGRPENYYD